MGTMELTSKVQELRELRRMAEELEGEIDALQDQIKAHMTVLGVSELHGADYWPKADFCYRCVGDCMESSGIRDGDIVFIHAQKTVNNGEIAVVEIDGRMYLKRFYAAGNKITLTADKQGFKPLVFVGHQRNDVMVIGKAVGYLSYLNPQTINDQYSDLTQDPQSAYSIMEKEALHLFRAMTPEQRTQILAWMENHSSEG